MPARPADGRARLRPALARGALPSARAQSEHSLYSGGSGRTVRARWQTPEEEEQIIALINTKLQAMHDRGLAAMSPRTRAAWAADQRFSRASRCEKVNAASRGPTS